MIRTKAKTPCITYAKAVIFDVPKFTSSKTAAAILTWPARSARAPSNAAVRNVAFEGSSSTGKRPAYLPTSESNCTDSSELSFVSDGNGLPEGRSTSSSNASSVSSKCLGRVILDRLGFLMGAQSHLPLDLWGPRDGVGLGISWALVVLCFRLNVSGECPDQRGNPA